MKDKNELSHIDSKGDINMVDVGHKIDSERVAEAKGFIKLLPETLAQIKSGKITKGNVLSTATIAGILASKNTAQTIPLCHNINLSSCNLSFEYLSDGIVITATVNTTGKTGVEIEALHAVSIAALTIYDMVKAIDKEMVISDIMLTRKSGGKTNINKKYPLLNKE